MMDIPRDINGFVKSATLKRIRSIFSDEITLKGKVISFMCGTSTEISVAEMLHFS